MRKILAIPALALLVAVVSITHAAYGLTETNITLSSSQEQSTIGQPAHFTATVSPSNGTIPDNETITFLDSNATIGTANTTGGIATFTANSLSLGMHSIMARYPGDANYTASTSAVLEQTVSQITTYTTVTVSKNPSLSGQQVTFTATVYPGTATGTVSFTIDGTAQPPVTVSSGQAVFNSSSLSVGSNAISAAYSGDTNDTASISNTITQTVYNSTTQINGVATRCSSISACSYTMTSNNQTGTAYTGYGISFRLPGEANTSTGPYGIQYTPVGGAYHVTGKFTATDVNTGKVVTGATDTYVRAYGHSGRGGGISFSLANGTITFNPTNQDGTTTTIACSPSSVPSGSTSVCTASVVDSFNASIPTGTVSLSASNSWLGTFSSSTCTLVSGSCSVNFKTNQEYGAGTTSIYATYSGDDTHYASSGRNLLYATSSGDD